MICAISRSIQGGAKASPFLIINAITSKYHNPLALFTYTLSFSANKLKT